MLGSMVARNLITDVPGLQVGHAEDAALASGVTAIVFDQPAVVAADVRGGAPGTRETDLLDAHRTVEKIDAVVLSGGSAFGLNSCAGVQAWLHERGRGFAIGNVTIPLVAGAVLFDMTNGGNKTWGRFSPYRDFGYAAAAAAGAGFALGTAGAGYGATAVTLKGGLGSASAVTRSGYTVGAIVAVNACGNTNVGGSKHFWAAPFEIELRVRRPRLSRESTAGRADPARQRPAGREHHHRAGRDRCGAHKNTGQAVRGDGAGRLCSRDLSGTHHT